MLKIKNRTNIIWDWNGTLLNDAELCVTCMNKVLGKRKMPLIDVNDYRRLFTFPVVDYYSALGFDFDKEKFEIPAMEFINRYYSKIGEADLFPCVIDVLKYFKARGFRQFVLSAMEHDNLIDSLTEKGIIDFFDDISGINDHYAHSKLEMGKDLIKKTSIVIDETIMIGDTVHDFEVASGLGVDCVLVSTGHQSAEKLLQTKANVIQNLDSVTTII